MEVDVFWTQYAIKKLNEIYAYYLEKAGVSVGKKLVNEIVRKSSVLKKGYLQGQKEPYLKDFELDFRYLVFKNYKIIYYYNKAKTRIEITNVFDCRQDPEKMKK